MCAHLHDKLTFTVKLFLLGLAPGSYSLSSFSASPQNKTEEDSLDVAGVLHSSVKTRAKALLPRGSHLCPEGMAATPAADSGM